VNLANVSDAKDWFEVLQTTERSQTAVMTLEPDGQSGEELNSHPESDQVLLVLEGEVFAEVSGQTATMKKGDVVIVRKGKKHRFSNRTQQRAVTFSVYAPPAYPD
jgi:mannose-6-phosphate isomerase-like protein (cupin superfamily)